jgi:hypothetical protein
MEIPKEHASQYDMLRIEIVSLIAETRKLEFAAVGAVAALYAWLAKSQINGMIWYIGTPLVLLAGIRSMTLFHRIEFIAAYLRRIEAKYFVEDPLLPGYERHFDQATSRERKAKTSRLAPTGIILWILLLAATIVGPSLLQKEEKEPKETSKITAPSRCG